jgi:hypothetical protein
MRRMVRSHTPAISAAASQVIFFAIAFKITSCNFIIRSTSAALNDPGFIKPQHRPRFAKADRSCVNSTGQITY